MKTEAVKSRDQLADFVDTLRDSLRERPDEWGNHSLEDDLEALAAYTRDLPGYCGTVLDACSC